jgi:hypothetical protein
VSERKKNEKMTDDLPAEVTQFDNMSVCVKKQVLRLDVSVANTHLVNVGEGTSN